MKSPTDDVTTLDANRPRFTLTELRQVLWERNELKTKLMEVEEELRLFKEQYKSSIIVFFINLFFVISREEENDDDNGAVEGPIPLEPDEKLYGQKSDESKIRQL